MSTWIWSGGIGLLFGGILFAVVMIPVLAVQYRRYGRFSPARMLGAMAVTLYGVSILTYTWLPLPEAPADFCATHAVGRNLVPFSFIADIRAAAAATSWTTALTGFVTLQVVFNVVLFVPWGVIARRYFGRSVITATLTGFAASLLIEVSQGTGLFGVYPCAFRVADVDDLILNTTGAFIGAVIAPALLWWMPRQRELAGSRMAPRPVTVWRRWTGMVIDAFAYSMTGYAALFVVAFVRYAMGLSPQPPSWAQIVLGTLLPWIVVFVVPAAGGWGSSAGQAAVWLAPAWSVDGSVGPGSRSRRLARVCAVSGVYVAAQAVGEATGQTWVSSLGGLWLFAAVVSVAVTRGRGLSAVLTGADIIDVRARASSGEDTSQARTA